MTNRSVEQFGAALADAGLPSLPSRVFSALLMDDDGRMTSAELTELLGVSAATVSGAVAQAGGRHRRGRVGSAEVLCPPADASTRARARLAPGRLRRRRRRLAR